jgi:hypothetical protein
MDAIPTFIGQEIERCAKAIKEAKAAMEDPEVSPLQKFNWQRRLRALQKQMRQLAVKKLPPEG